MEKEISRKIRSAKSNLQNARRSLDTGEAINWVCDEIRYSLYRLQMMLLFQQLYDRRSAAVSLDEIESGFNPTPLYYCTSNGDNYAIADRPFFSTSDNSFRDGPAGCFSPRSH